MLAYSVRALGGLLYLAGIPDLSGLDARSRSAVVKRIFDVYKSREGVAEQVPRIAALYSRLGFLPRARGDREAGFSNPDTRVVIEAMSIWDSVQALGFPDRSEDPIEGPGYFLLTACNVRKIIHPLSLDDNRAYSFTPILAGGSAATAVCRGGGGRQDESPIIKDVWFSGAHADVGGTYETGAALLDGELSSVSLNWVISELLRPDCSGCRWALALPEGLKVPEDRLSAVHDGKRSTTAYRGLFRQTRKPRVYWSHVYGKDAPLAVHASVIDRLEWLFLLDGRAADCNRKRQGPPLLCAQELASYGLVPELLKEGCLQSSAWGYRLTPDPKQPCVDVVGTRSHVEPPFPIGCVLRGSEEDHEFEGRVYTGPLEAAERRVVATHRVMIPFRRAGPLRNRRTSIPRADRIARPRTDGQRPCRAVFHQAKEVSLS